VGLIGLLLACAPDPPECGFDPGPIFWCEGPGTVTLDVVTGRGDTRQATGDGRAAVWLLPPSAPLSFQVTTEDGASSGYTSVPPTPPWADLQATAEGDAGGLSYLLTNVCDQAATVVWVDPLGVTHWALDLVPYGAEGLYAYHWTRAGTLLAAITPTTVVEVDPLGVEVGRWDITWDGYLHHDVGETAAGLLLLTAWAVDGVIDDRVTELSRDGQVLRYVDASALIDGPTASAGNLPDAFWSWAFPGAVSATHTNSARALPDGRWLMSWRQADAIVAVDPDAPLVDPWIVEGEDGPGLEPTVSGVVPFAYPHGATAGDDGVVWLLDNGRGVDSEVVGLVDDDGVIEEIARVSLGRACPESGGVWPVGDGSFVATCAREKQALRVLPGGDGPVWALTSGCVAPEPSPATPDAIPRFVPGDPLAPHEAGDRARVHTGAAPRVRGDRTHVE
jgi:hypothetical protein